MTPHSASKWIAVALACAFAIGCGYTAPSSELTSIRPDESETLDSAHPSPWPSLYTPAQKLDIGINDAAVIVAIEDYAYQEDIPGAKENGLAWLSYFQSGLSIPPDKVHTLFSDQAGKESILRAVQEAVKEASINGRVWFVFIGHGTTSADGRGLILGADTPANNPDGNEDRGILHNDLIALLEKSRAQPIVILDSCYSGITPSGDPINPGLMPARVASISSPKRALILSAAASDQRAGDLPMLGAPAFSYLALGALRGWGDLDGDGEVRGDELVAFANRVIKMFVVGRSQTSQMHGDFSKSISMSGGEGPPDLTAIRLSTLGGGNSDPDELPLVAEPPPPVLVDNDGGQAKPPSSYGYERTERFVPGFFPPILMGIGAFTTVMGSIYTGSEAWARQPGGGITLGIGLGVFVGSTVMLVLNEVFEARGRKAHAMRPFSFSVQF